MFQEAVSGMEKRLFNNTRMGPDAYRAVKETTKLGVVTGSVYGATDLASKFLGKMAAYAESVCHPGRLDLDKLHFSTLVHNINAAISSYIESYPEATIGELNKHFVGGNTLNLTGKVSECLAVVHNVNPDKVAQFSSKTQEVFSYDMSRLMDVAPELVKYTTVPEYGELVGIIAGASLAGLLIAKRFPEIKDYIQKHSVKLGHGIGSIMQYSRNSFKHNKDSSRNKN